MAIDVSKYENAIILSHPLLAHKITQLRDKDTKTNQFRVLVKEIAILEGYEALRHLKTHNIDIETPVEKTSQPVVDRKNLCFVPILRAGLGMVDGITRLIPTAKVGHVGLYRDETTLEPHEYYAKFPPKITEANVLVVDPMLATGGSAIHAIDVLKRRGVTNISYVGLVGAPEGVKALQKAHPDVNIFLASLDEKLNEIGYIVPGLGDCGDRLFGTK